MDNALELAKQNQALARPLEFTPEQRQMIRDSYANGASESEFAVMMEIARARNLNPLLRQVFFVERWDSQKNRKVWSAQVSIDGLRAIAQRTGLYDGQGEPEFEYDSDGRVRCAKVAVYRKDWTRPVVGVAHFDEYAQKTKEGKLTMMWATKSHIMVSKCAEALALRKAFPEDTAGLYVPEEMQQDQPVASYPVSKIETNNSSNESHAVSHPETVSKDRIDEFFADIAQANTTAELNAVAYRIKKEPKAIGEAVRSAYAARKKELSSATTEKLKSLSAEMNEEAKG